LRGEEKDHEEADEYQGSSAYIGIRAAVMLPFRQQEEPLPALQGAGIQNHPIRTPPGQTRKKNQSRKNERV
jgi:hypothetical protein